MSSKAVTNFRARRFPYWLLIFFSIIVAAIAIELYFTRYGAGATGDAVHYVQGAINMRAGRGYSRFSGEWKTLPITGFPPMLSIALAGLGGLFTDLFQAGRFFNALCWGGNIALVCLILMRFTRSWKAALIGGIFLLVVQNMLLIHSWVMTEALYILLTLLALLFLIVFLDTDRLRYLILSSVFVGLSILTRYVGLTMIPVGCLAILWLGKGAWKKRCGYAGLFGLLAVLPFLGWMIRNSVVSDQLVNRQLAYHPIAYEIINAMVNETVGWFFPLSMAMPRILRRIATIAIIIVVPVGFVIVQFKRGVLRKIREWRQAESLPWVLILFIPAYMFLLLFNTAFLDASTSVGGARRYLIPVFVMVVILIVAVLYDALWRRKSSWVAWSILLLAFVLIGFHAYETAQIIREPGYIFGYLDNKRSWGDEVAALAEFNPDRAFIANDVEHFYYLSGYPAYAFPIPYDQYTQQPRDDYDAQLDRTQEILGRGGIIVLIKPTDQDEQVLSSLAVQQLWESSKIAIYSRSEP